MKQSRYYQSIDMIQTGYKLKNYMDQIGMSIKEIQEYLYLSCPQPIYRWIQGKVLPSVDHLLMLSELFNVHMEELLVKKKSALQVDYFLLGDISFKERITAYYKKLVKYAA